MNWSRAVTVPRRPSDLKTEFPGLPSPWHCAIVSQASENITAGCPLIANPCFQRWDKFERSFDTNGLSRDVSKWRSFFKGEPRWAATQASTTMHWEGAGGRCNQNGKQSSPLGRQSLFYILPLSLKWVIAFLPRRLRRAMKAKVLQRCSTHLQIYNKIQHDNFFFPREISGASEQLLNNFPFSQYFSIQHPEKHGEPTVARKAKPNKKQNRDRGEK